MPPNLVTMPPQHHPLECQCAECLCFWKKLASTESLNTHDLDWLDKIALAVEEDRTPEREAALSARLLEL